MFVGNSSKNIYLSISRLVGTESMLNLLLDSASFVVRKKINSIDLNHYYSLNLMMNLSTKRRDKSSIDMHKQMNKSTQTHSIQCLNDKTTLFESLTSS